MEQTPYQSLVIMVDPRLLGTYQMNNNITSLSRLADEHARLTRIDDSIITTILSGVSILGVFIYALIGTSIKSKEWWVNGGVFVSALLLFTLVFFFRGIYVSGIKKRIEDSLEKFKEAVFFFSPEILENKCAVPLTDKIVYTYILNLVFCVCLLERDLAMVRDMTTMRDELTITIRYLEDRLNATREILTSALVRQEDFGLKTTRQELFDRVRSAFEQLKREKPD